MRDDSTRAATPLPRLVLSGRRHRTRGLYRRQVDLAEVHPAQHGLVVRIDLHRELATALVSPNVLSPW